MDLGIGIRGARNSIGALINIGDSDPEDDMGLRVPRLVGNNQCVAGKRYAYDS